MTAFFDHVRKRSISKSANSVNKLPFLIKNDTQKLSLEWVRPVSVARLGVFPVTLWRDATRAVFERVRGSSIGHRRLGERVSAEHTRYRVQQKETLKKHFPKKNYLFCNSPAMVKINCAFFQRSKLTLIFLFKTSGVSLCLDVLATILGFETLTILHDINFFLTHWFDRFSKTRKMRTSEIPLTQKWMHFRIPVPGHALAGKRVHALEHLRVRLSNQSNCKNTVFEKYLTPLSTR